MRAPTSAKHILHGADAPLFARSATLLAGPIQSQYESRKESLGSPALLEPHVGLPGSMFSRSRKVAVRDLVNSRSVSPYFDLVAKSGDLFSLGDCLVVTFKGREIDDR